MRKYSDGPNSHIFDFVAHPSYDDMSNFSLPSFLQNRAHPNAHF